MDSVLRYYLSFLFSKFPKLIVGRNYKKWKEELYSLKSVRIKNSKLAKEIETVSRNNSGILTYSELLFVDQFGKNGFHATHHEHGITNTHKSWAKAIVKLCKEKGYKQVVEVGSGEGHLAIDSVKEAEKENFHLFWNCVEINKGLHGVIASKFRKEKLEENLSAIASSTLELKKNKKCLVIYSYVLDSIAPDIFINTTSSRKYPNAMLGMVIKDGILTEQVISSEVLKKKGISLTSGKIVYKGFSFDLSSWKLFTGQRAYIPLSAFYQLAQAAYHFSSDSLFLIIDELRARPTPFEVRHLSVPRDLLGYMRDLEARKGYRDAGKYLYYFPFYYHSLEGFLQSLGFKSIESEIEEKMAKDILKQEWIPKKTYFATYAFLCTKLQKTTKSLKIPLVSA